MPANPIDIHVGKRLRLRRSIMGVSQEQLADALGITFQQVQKYEKGINRIGSSRLYEISKALEVPVGYFFEEYGAEDNMMYGLAEEIEAYDAESSRSRETMALVRAYYQISDPKIRKKALELIKSLADKS